MARIAAIVVAAALAATPAAAVAAQSNPFLPEEAPQEAPSTPSQAPAPAPVQEAETNTTLSSGTVVVIGIAIIGLLGGIWYVISRDAQRATAGRTRVRTARDDDALAMPQGRSATRAAPRARKPSAAERKRRKRGRAR